ncbi:uncharacterized protein TNCV_1445661 [Trichonephila clavipes]|nr:uncharacterized protein TNCV_1445661 [Trichonephila clavipes]
MLDHLEDNIRRVIADIRSQMLEKVIENWTSRLDYIRASRGSPMPEIIFKINTHYNDKSSSGIFHYFCYLKISTDIIVVVVFFSKGRNECCQSMRQVEILYDRWRHYLSPQFRHGTGGERNILQPPAPVVSDATSHKTFGPTDLTSTYSMCTRRVFSGIEPRPSGMESDALTSRLPTALADIINVLF